MHPYNSITTRMIMAFIGKQPEQPIDNTATTVIADGTLITGEIKSDAIYIYGSFEGKIISNGTITIALSGYCKGEIKTNNLIVGGQCEGNISCECLEVLNKGDLKGSVACNEFVVEKGGFFEGDIKKKEKSNASINTTNKTTHNNDSDKKDKKDALKS